VLVCLESLVIANSVSLGSQSAVEYLLRRYIQGLYPFIHENRTLMPAQRQKQAGLAQIPIVLIFQPLITK
jgi:hypothetical protein